MASEVASGVAGLALAPSKSVKGAWRGPGSTGGPSAAENPQFELFATEAADVKLTLVRAGEGGKLAMQIVVYKGAHEAGRRRFTRFVDKDVVNRSPMSGDRQVALNLSLPASPAPYMVAIFLSGKGDEADFELTTSAGLLSPLPDLHLTSENGRWSTGLDGGPKNCQNPQFRLYVPQDADLDVRLSQPAKAAGIMFMMQPLGDRKVRFRQLLTEGVIESPFVRSMAVSVSRRFEAGTYAIICMREQLLTGGAGAGALTVTVQSTVPGVTLSELGDAPRPPNTTSAEAILAKYASPISPKLLLSDPYAELLAHCREKNAMFVDAQFPPAESSLNWVDPRDPRGKGIPPLEPVEWRRSIDVSNVPTVFSGGIEPDDLEQGDVGDCWFCQAVANVAQNPQAVMDLFHPDEYNEYGFYSIRLFYRGAFYFVMVDDHIPTRNGGQCFAHNREDLDELWVSLLEKAMAKVFGSYRLADGRSMQLGMQLLTGGLTQSLALSKERAEEHWEILRKAANGKYLIGAASRSGMNAESIGIVDSHAYALLDARPVLNDKVRLLLLRNTWGKTEWLGDWSDGSSQWERHPEARAELGHSDADDGRFWISMDDFVKYFDEAAVCKFTDSYVNQRPLMGSWESGKTAGGRQSPSNPQFALKLTETSDVALILRNDLDPRPTGDGIGMAVYAVPPAFAQRRLVSLREEDLAGLRLVEQTKYVEHAEVVIDIPALPAGDYVVVAFRYDPEAAGPFVLSLFATTQSTQLTELAVPPQDSARAVVENASFSSPDLCGGPANAANPQFALTVSNAATDLTLQATNIPLGKPPAYAVQIFLQRAGQPGTRVGLLSKPDSVAKSNNAQAASTHLGALQVPPGDYIVVVCASEEGKRGDFRLSASATSAQASVDLTLLNPGPSVNVSGKWERGMCGGPASASNPQIRLKLNGKQKQSVLLRLARTNGGTHGLRIVLVKADARVSEIGEMVGHSPFMAESSVDMQQELEPGVNYVAVLGQEQEDVAEAFTFRATPLHEKSTVDVLIL